MTLLMIPSRATTLRQRALAPRIVAFVAAVAPLLWLGASGAPDTAGAARAPKAVAPKALHALGATITVNQLTQDITSDGLCSLQEAIFSANRDTNTATDGGGSEVTTGCAPGNGTDTIVLAANAVYIVTGDVANVGNEVGPSVNPPVTTGMIIQGNGARLERQGSLNVRAFDVLPGGNLTIQNLHVKNFRGRGGNGSEGGGGGMGAGGAIYNRAASVTIENSTFSENNAIGGSGSQQTTIAGGGGGGGLSGNGGNDVAFGSGNAGGGGGGARGNGGDGANSGGGGGGTRDNGADGAGSGAGGAGGANCGGKGGDNTGAVNGVPGACVGGGGGGGGFQVGAGNVGGSGGNGNYGGGGGGGAASAQGNAGSGGSGGFGGGGGSGGPNGNGGNGGFGGGAGAAGPSGGSVGSPGFGGGDASATTGGAGTGVGSVIFNENGTVIVRNSTFADNNAFGGADGPGLPGIFPRPGGNAAIMSRNGVLRVTHSTFSNNRGTGFADIWVLGDGATANFELRNSILANPNAPANGYSCVVSTNNGGSISQSGSGNLMEQPGVANGPFSPCAGLVQTGDPQLGPLQITAPGNTPTMAIGAGSPALDAADAAFGLPTDQRGVTRPQGIGFDIGAFEAIVVDISLVKSCYARPIAGSPTQDPDVVIAGQQWICDIVVNNPGAIPLADLTVTDSVPAGARFVADTSIETQIGGAVPVCTPQGVSGPATVTCTGIDVAAFGEARFQLAFTISPSFVATAPTGELPISNTACVVVVNFIDPDLTNNCDTETDLVKDLADLRVTKFVESTHNPVRAGEIFTYTIYVDNLGPSVARNVTITDTFLSSNSVSIQSCAFSVSQGGGAITQFTCTTGNVVSTQFGTDIGTFSTNRLDPVGVVGSPPPSGGHQGRLRASFRLVARTDLQTTNTVRAHALTPDPNTSNNLATVELRAESVADLSVTKSAEGEEQQVNQPGLMFNNAIFNQPFPTGPNYFVSTRVTAGRRIHYQVTVRNNGPSVAENVVLYDRLPAGVRFYQGSLIVERSVPNGLVTVLPTPCATGTPGIALDKMTCGLGSLLVGQSMFINFQVVTDANLAPGAILENDAWTTSDTLDISNVNNYGFTQNTVLAAADMGVSKSAVGQVVTAYNAPFHQFIVTDVANQVTAGKVLRYQIQVQNNGPSDGRNVTIQENLPAAPVPGPVTFLRADGASCRPDSVNQQLLFCDLGDMVAGARETFDLYVLVDPSVPTGTLLTNTATALQSGSNVVPPGAPPSIPGVDPTRPITWDPCVACGPTGNANAAVNLTTATAVADVSVEKVDVPADAALDRPFEPDLAIAGNEHRYQITIGNNGPSTAVNVGVRDLLDFKQPGILGETFVRCEPIDPDDIVTCSLTLPNEVTVTRLQVGNEAVIPTAGTGTLVPNRQYGFYLITRVDAGYVLDGTDLLAEDTATISSSTTDFRFQNNTDRHQTLITAEADLSLTKADDAAGFLTCDPVAPGGTITYDLVVTNNGPADAADVYVVDQLPANFVAVDPALVNVIVSRGQVIEVRDDGWITIRVGNDVNNSGTTELGRVNAGSAPVTIRITTTVRLDAACGQQAANTARVETRRNDAPRGLTGGWPPAPQPFPGIDGGPRTPTIDPNGANNAAVALTTIECPRIQVIKTVSFDGKCPGVNISAGVFNQTGQPITFCFEVTNTGTTFLDDIFLSDVLDTRTMEPTEIYSDTITSGADPNTPLKPGETVNRKVTVDHALLKWDCGEITDTVTVTANPVNSGRTDLPCLDDVTDDDTAVIDVPCAGVDWRLQLPVLGGPTCPTLVQVQNLGRKDTKVILVVWGEESFCPPQAAGPLKVECGGLLRPGSSWTFTASQLPSAARSAVLYSVNATDIVMNVDGNESRFDLEVCDALMTHVVGNWKQWSVFDLAYRRQRVYRSPFDGSGLHQIVLDFKAHQGEPIAATVNRSCPDAADPNVMSNAVYTGISSDQEGARDPVSGARMFYAPLVFAGKGGLSSKVCIQNSGDECTSLELWFKGQDECLRNTLADVLTLSPGETVCFDPATVVGPDWLGSAHIRSTQPLGIVVDTMGPNHFTSYNGVAADVFALGFSAGNQIAYLPLTYSEYQGWDTAIQVQNLDPTLAAKVKVYFLDRGGDIITTLVDWVCPRGSQTFFLPVIANIPGSWAGSARVESAEWITPGGPNVLAPRIVAVALMERWSDPARTTRREAIAYNAQGECLLYDWQLGSGTGGTASGAGVLAFPLIAKGNRGIDTELAITNLVPKPGFTDFVLFFYDQNGLIDQVCQKVTEKQVDYIDLNQYGFLDRGFLGSAVVSAVFWEHDVFDARGQFVRNVVGLGAVAIERVGTAGSAGADLPGDESKGYEAFPVFDTYQPNDPLRCPGVPGGFGGR